MNRDRIPINTGKFVAGQYDYDQVIIYARRFGNGEAANATLEWVTTYGRTKAHCAAAAKIGDAIRDSVTPTLERQASRIVELEAERMKLWKALENLDARVDYQEIDDDADRNSGAPTPLEGVIHRILWPSAEANAGASRT